MADARSDGVKSSIIMRVEEPADDEENEDNADNEKTEVDMALKSSKTCSPALTKPLLTTSKFGSSNPFTSNNTAKFGSKSLLKPSKLVPNCSAQSVRNPFMLNPSRLNPFAKPSVGESTSNSDSDKTNRNISASNGEMPKFVPLLQSEKKSGEIVKPVSTILPATQVKQTDFIFGQNLKERVISDDNDDPKPSTSCISSNGTSDMLFSSAIKDTVKPESADAKETKSLSESAREYEESRANKRKYEQVEVITGEEEETNVLHISCKLFAYDQGNYQERGRGNIRLNDQEIVDSSTSYTQSRVVFRTTGNFKVILNTKVWANMTVQRAGVRTLRLTALGTRGEVKVYAVMGSPEDINKLHKHLEDRIKMEAERQRHKKVTTAKETDGGSDFN